MTAISQVPQRLSKQLNSSMSPTIAIPGKTFLLGEYAVLTQGPAIIATHKPYFLLSENTLPISGSSYHVHPKSPAGLLQQILNKPLKQYLFYDLYPQKGGMGASGAEFLGHYIYEYGLEYLQNTQNMQKLLKLFRELTYTENSIPPSGVDIIAQLTGKITFIEQNNQQVSSQSYQWPFEDLAFYLVHTGCKINTHDHLSDLQTLPFDELSHIVYLAQNAFSKKDTSAFIKCIEPYQDILNKHGLLANHSQILLEKIQQNPDVLACKGCGAMGSDTLCILSHTDKKSSMKKMFNDLSLSIIAEEVDLGEGAHYHQ